MRGGAGRGRLRGSGHGALVDDPYVDLPPLRGAEVRQVEDQAEPARLDEIENELKAQLDEMRERGLAAPFPAELHAREFKD